jgi:RNA polymerase sigma factor (sigma-70 family)
MGIFPLPSAPPEQKPAPADPLGHLVTAGANGDREAVRTLIVSVGPAILRAVRGVIGATHPDVEDVAQDAVFAFVRALPRFRAECSTVHFASRIAMLTALAARRRARTRSITDPGVDPDREPSPQGSPARLASAAMRRETLRALCERLPQPQADALVMMCVLGLTVEEIAAATDVPVNTVWSRLRHAKKALRERVRNNPRLREALEVDE